MERDIRIYSTQFPPWFKQKPKVLKMHIAFALEQIVVERNWPLQLFQRNLLYPDLLLLPVVLEDNKIQYELTIIGFCPVNTDKRFVVLMGCDEAPNHVHTACFDKAKGLQAEYLIR